MVTVYGELAIFDTGDAKRFALALVVLHLDLGADAAELGLYILQIVSEGKLRPVGTESLSGTHTNGNFIAVSVSFERRFDLLDQTMSGTVEIPHRQIHLLDNTAVLINDAVDELDVFVVAYGLGHERRSGPSQ